MKWFWRVLALYSLTHNRRRKNTRSFKTAAKVGTAAVSSVIGLKAGWKLGKKL